MDSSGNVPLDWNDCGTGKYNISCSDIYTNSEGDFAMDIKLTADAEVIGLPKKIIYNGTTTICIFDDGEKIKARPTKDDDFDKEVGVAMCIMKRIFGSRSAFQRVVEKGYDQNKPK